MVIWLRDVDIKCKIWLWERLLEHIIKESRYRIPDLVFEREEEFEVVQISLADSDQGALADETAELARGVDFEPFAQDENVGDGGGGECRGRERVGERVFQVVGGEGG